jgi:predicted O-linked N-acetylglucosamine transferase (SPINDLY family)
MTGPEDSKTATVFKRICPANRWRSLVHVDLVSACQAIVADRIDILVELGGHSAGSRLDIMACKPAPVQVTWIGYANSTGLPVVDYRITDEIADPRDTRQQFAEELVRMPSPRAFLCYTPNADVPKVSDLPALSNGYITFGSFNALGKVNQQVMSLWCAVLNAVPNSRVFMKCKHFATEEIKQRYLDTFVKAGIAAHRVTLMAMTPTIAEHLRLYSKIDVAIDTFPYAGTTTTAEALYMGVPVVTYYRTRAPIHAQNVGAALLQRIPGMDRFVAKSRADYVRICQEASKDLDQLAEVRRSLRPKMLVSPLCDGPMFCRGLETLLTDMWKAHCAGKKLINY